MRESLQAQGFTFLRPHLLRRLASIRSLLECRSFSSSSFFACRVATAIPRFAAPSLYGCTIGRGDSIRHPLLSTHKENTLSAIPREELSRRLRRGFERFKFTVNAELVWQSQKKWGRVVDVSRSGLFIQMDEPLARGARFNAHLALNVPLQLNCEVKRIVPGLGVGVAITVPEGSKKRFEALLQALSFSSDPAATAAKASFPDAPRPIARAAVAAAGSSSARRR